MTIVMLRRCVIATVIPLASCGSPEASTTANADTGAVAEDALADSREDVATADAPATCGTNVGDILCDLPLEGHVRDGVADGVATSAPYTSGKLSEILANGTQKYGFIWTSAYW